MSEDNKTPSVILENVSKWYGQVMGINDISLAIEGGVTGILGPNGAGKSTLFKLLMGRLKPSQGNVKLFGIDPWSDTSPYRRIGYVSESERLYDWMTAQDFVSTLARLHGMTREEANARAEHVLDLHGCDPIARTSIMNVIRELGSQGKTVLVSSHILEEIERITEQIVILHNGRLLALGNLYAIRDLLDKHPHRIMITTDEPRKLASAFIGEEPVYGVRFPEEGKLEIQTNDLSAAHSVLPRVIVDSKVSVSRIDNPDDNLESLLGYLIGGT